VIGKKKAGGSAADKVTARKKLKSKLEILKGKNKS